MRPKPDRVEPVALNHAGSERGYLLRMPSPIPERPVPLVVELHGRGIGPAMFDRWTGFGELGGMKPVSRSRTKRICAPGTTGGTADRRGAVTRRSTRSASSLPSSTMSSSTTRSIRPACISSGWLNGATMAGRVAWERPDRITAVAQVAGTGAVGLIPEFPHPAVPVPLLQIHGTRDRLRHMREAERDAGCGCSGDVRSFPT